jgi:hypothetical protein
MILTHFPGLLGTLLKPVRSAKANIVRKSAGMKKPPHIGLFTLRLYSFSFAVDHTSSFQALVSNDFCKILHKVPTSADRGRHVVSVTDPYGRLLGFLDRSSYFFFQAALQLYSRG